MIKTLFITQEVPYPLGGGVTLRNWQNINIMIHYGPVAVFSVSNWTPQHQKIPNITLWKHYNVIQKRNFWDVTESRLWWLRPKGHPDTDWPYAKAVTNDLSSLLKDFKPDVVVFEQVWLYRYLPIVKNYSCKIILDQHNLEADVYRQKYAYTNNLRMQLKKTLQLPQLLKLEKDFVHKVNQVWVCSEEDALMHRQYYGVDTIVIPNGVNPANYENVRLGTCVIPEGLEDINRNIIFMGQLSYEPNKVGVEWLLREILPRLKGFYPSIRLLLVGRNPTSFMLEAAEKDPHIIVTGSVKDVNPYLAASSLLLVPLLQGGGTRLKILEAFAAGVPIITTSKGVEGIKAIDGKHLLVRDTVDEIVEGFKEIKSNPYLTKKLRDNAYELLLQEYSWDASAGKVEAALRRLAMST